MSAETAGGSPLRLLALLPTLRGGGSERVMLTLLRHLDRRQFVPMLAVVDARAADLAHELSTDVPPVDLGCRRVRHAVPALLGVIRRQRPDVVLSTLGHLNLMLAMLRPLLPGGLRLVGRESSLLSDQIGNEPWPAAWRAGYRRFYRRLDLVICQSHAMRDDLCTHFGVAPARTVVIPNPVDIDRVRALAADPAAAPRPPGARWRFVAVGRLVPEKGLDTLLRALAACGDLAWCLDVLGQGPEQARLRELAKVLRVDERVRWLGFVANPYPWLRAADALVLSSRYEGLPNVVLEALACGTPVITTPVPGVLEIVGGIDTAEVAAGFDADALAAAVRRWTATSRPRAAASTVEGYAVGPVVRRYEEALRRAVAV